jgi:hypothetical protein
VRDGVSSNVHKQCGLGVEYVLKNSLVRRTLDNVTVVMIAFSNFKKIAFGGEKSVVADKSKDQIRPQSTRSKPSNSMVSQGNNENVPP